MRKDYRPGGSDAYGRVDKQRSLLPIVALRYHKLVLAQNRVSEIRELHCGAGIQPALIGESARSVPRPI